MDTVEYFVDHDGWPWNYPNSWYGPTNYVIVPIEIDEVVSLSKNCTDEKDYAAGIVADWMEENRELLYQLNPNAHSAVDRMTEYFRRMWELVGK